MGGRVIEEQVCGGEGDRGAGVWGEGDRGAGVWGGGG